MFKRLFWLMMGAGFGFGVSFWLMRQIRATVERYSPPRVSADLSKAARRFGQDVRAAVADGRTAMAEYERDVRTKIETNANGKLTYPA